MKISKGHPLLPCFSPLVRPLETTLKTRVNSYPHQDVATALSWTNRCGEVEKRFNSSIYSHQYNVIDKIHHRNFRTCFSAFQTAFICVPELNLNLEEGQVLRSYHSNFELKTRYQKYVSRIFFHWLVWYLRTFNNNSVLIRTTLT